jgi:hypothetical protein
MHNWDICGFARPSQHRVLQRARFGIVAMLACVFLMWAGYRFTSTPIILRSPISDPHRWSAPGSPPYRVIGREDLLPGYVAVSLRYLYLSNVKDGGLQWIKKYRPIERIGTSIDLFYLDHPS